MIVSKIVSGGQTGADQGALDTIKNRDEFLEYGGCVTFELNDLGSLCPKICGLKANNELDNKGGNDYDCDYIGKWWLCPHYVRDPSCKRLPNEDLPGQMLFPFAEDHSECKTRGQTPQIP